MPFSYRTYMAGFRPVVHVAPSYNSDQVYFCFFLCGSYERGRRTTLTRLFEDYPPDEPGLLPDWAQFALPTVTNTP